MSRMSDNDRSHSTDTKAAGQSLCVRAWAMAYAEHRPGL